ncbi:TOBE domain-containing protein [Thiothrix litoralis]|jgi:molybdate transport system regulatory protein|nr:TOBE domain-containing protein [Thiothrix litoralis]
MKEITKQMQQLMATPLRHGRRWDYLELLERIDATGSISAASKAMGMSYKAAWEAVLMVNNLSEEPVVERQAGGQHGGGTNLTAYGRRMVMVYRHLEKEHARILSQLGQVADNFEQYFQLIRKFDMQTSSRNQFLGTVTKVTNGPINSEVILDIGGGDELVAVITHNSVDHLGLAPGVQAYALVKAPWVILAKDDGKIKTSARNNLRGTIVSLQEGAVNAEVIIELPGGKTVTAIITNDSVQDMELKVGDKACALIKASHIIIAVSN